MFPRRTAITGSTQLKVHNLKLVYRTFSRRLLLGEEVLVNFNELEPARDGDSHLVLDCAPYSVSSKIASFAPARLDSRSFLLTKFLDLIVDPTPDEYSGTREDQKRPHIHASALLPPRSD